MLDITGKEGAHELLELSRTVKSGDADNREAVAAKRYFPRLKPGYARNEISATTSILNYGYAIVRSSLARSVVSHGFITSVGLFHENGRNEFNLVDDLIEPFRPLIDLQMLELDLAAEDPANLSRPVRREMTSVLRNACIIGGRKKSCLLAVDDVVVSLMRALEDRDACKLSLPGVLPVEKVD